MFDKIKHSLNAKKQAYEASAGMMASLTVACIFALGAAVVWLAGVIGTIPALLTFAAIFMVIAYSLKLIADREDKQAERDIKQAGQQISYAAQAISDTAKSAVEVPAQPPVLISAAALAAIFLLLLIQRGR